jgi:hypothetical protein
MFFDNINGKMRVFCVKNKIIEMSDFLKIRDGKKSKKKSFSLKIEQKQIFVLNKFKNNNI